MKRQRKIVTKKDAVKKSKRNSNLQKNVEQKRYEPILCIYNTEKNLNHYSGLKLLVIQDQYRIVL